MTDTLKVIMDKVGANESKDMVNHPEHYCVNGIETLDVIQAKMSPAAYEGYLRGNVLKYILRCEYKGSKVEDIKKAEFYLNRLSEVISD